MKSCVGALDTRVTSHADLQELTQLKRCRPASCLASFLGSRCHGHCYYAHFLDKEISTERPRNFPKDTQLVNGSQAHNPGHSHHRAPCSGPTPPVPSLLLKRRPGYSWGKGPSEGEVTAEELGQDAHKAKAHFTQACAVVRSGRQAWALGLPHSPALLGPVQGQRHVSQAQEGNISFLI